MGRRVLTSNLPAKLNNRALIGEIETATGLSFANGDFSLSTRNTEDNTALAEIVIVIDDRQLNAMQTAVEAHAPAKSNAEEDEERRIERAPFDIDRIIEILKDHETRITALGG